MLRQTGLVNLPAAAASAVHTNRQRRFLIISGCVRLPGDVGDFCLSISHEVGVIGAFIH